MMAGDDDGLLWFDLLWSWRRTAVVEIGDIVVVLYEKRFKIFSIVDVRT